MIAGLGAVAGVEADLGPLAAAYVLVLAILDQNTDPEAAMARYGDGRSLLFRLVFFGME